MVLFHSSTNVNIHTHMHNHLFELNLQLQNLLVSPVDLQSECLDLYLQLRTDLEVFEVPDPVKDVLLCFLLEDVLMQDLVLRL